MTPEAMKVQEELKKRGIDLVDRFGLFEVAGDVIRQETASQREKDAAFLEARAAELEPLDGKPEMIVWKHGFLLGLASSIRAQK